MQTEMAREKQINFRVSEDEAKRFEALAAHYGIPMAAMLRMLVKEKHDSLQRFTRSQEEVFRALWGTSVPMTVGGISEKTGRAAAWIKPIITELEARGAVEKKGAGWMPTLIGNGILQP